MVVSVVIIINSYMVIKSWFCIMLNEYFGERVFVLFFILSLLNMVIIYFVWLIDVDEMWDCVFII